MEIYYPRNKNHHHHRIKVIMSIIYDEKNYPPPFPAGLPSFVEDLKKHIPFVPVRDDSAPVGKDSFDILKGIAFDIAFDDPEKRLETAFADLRRFLGEAGVPEQGSIMRFELADTLEGEDFILTVSPDGLLLEGGSFEGIRRGVYYLMDKISALRTPGLACGSEKKHYWLKNRISRCFFGPIKRPPFNVDELMNDIDYYPDEYLSRLAREGINGLWLTVTFSELATTSFRPASPDAPRRIAKLRATVAKCLRYGIKTWIFCIEPARWLNKDNPLPEGCEEMLGPGYSASLTAGYDSSMRSFCPNSETAERYLYESTYSIFSQVPGLGGQITISHGERMTSCLSMLAVTSPENRVTACKKQCSLEASDIISRTLLPMARGIKDASPDAELISWLYQPGEMHHENWIYTLPEKLTFDVNLAYNFESGITGKQLGRIHTGGDYWLSCTGPSDRFSRMAKAASGHCGMAAKLQVACSHEVATVPDVPVPGQLYRKYRAMHALGVTHAIQCWYFGNYPGLMNQASGMLACEDFTTDEETFLKKLASVDWAGCEDQVIRAWELFSKAYSNYPLEKMFQYYGPVHDGPVWPLHLKQVRRQLPRTWQPDNMPAGDVLGEALREHSVSEVCTLLGRMASHWAEGFELLKQAAEDFPQNKMCQEQLSAALALKIQFASAHNIFRFYSMRDALFAGAPDTEELLSAMEQIVHDEIANSRALCDACKLDTRLGYHSEAEIFKYYPEKLEWRIRILEGIILKDFAECRKALAEGKTFAEFAECRETLRCVTNETYRSGRLSWKAQCTAEKLRIRVNITDPTDADEEFLKFHMMDESGNIHPFMVNTAIARKSDEKVDWTECVTLAKRETGNGWEAEAVIPRQLLRGKTKVLFGVELVEYRNGVQSNITWPAGPFKDTLRLLLGYFTPDRLGLLEL